MTDDILAGTILPLSDVPLNDDVDAVESDDFLDDDALLDITDIPTDGVLDIDDEDGLLEE